MSETVHLFFVALPLQERTGCIEALGEGGESYPDGCWVPFSTIVCSLWVTLQRLFANSHDLVDVSIVEVRGGEGRGKARAGEL